MRMSVFTCAALGLCLVSIFAGHDSNATASTKAIGATSDTSVSWHLASCLPAQISAKKGSEVSPATGQHPVIITLTNRGTRPCVLDGYLRVKPVTATGRVLRLPQFTRSQYFRTVPERHVELRVAATRVRRACQVPLRSRQPPDGCPCGVHAARALEVGLQHSAGFVPGLTLCKGGATDPGNSFAVTPVVPSIGAIRP